MNLDNRNPEYLATEEARDVGLDLYSGEAAVKAQKTAYLHQETNESDADFALRLKRAVLDPYCKRIISARQAVMFRKEHVRELPATLQVFADDIDRQGTPGDVFFEQAAERAQVAGVHWVLVDTPPIPENGFASAKAQKESGHRPFMSHVPAGVVIDWEVGDDMDLLWAVMRYSVAQEERGPGESVKTRTQWRVWTRYNWATYELAAKSAQTGSESRYVVVAEGAHPLGSVPLVPFLGIAKTSFSGEPVTTPVHGHIVAIYNKQSDRDWFERLVGHPIPYMIAPEKPQQLDAGKGLWLKSTTQGQVEVGYLEVTGAAFSALNSTIAEYKANIYRLALAQAQKESAQVQSADGQREDRKAFTSDLKADSRAYESAEQQCWEIMAKWQSSPGVIKIQYNRDFDDSVIEAAMITELRSLVTEEIITRKTLLETLKAGEIVNVEDTDTELSEAAAESATRTASVAVQTLAELRAERDAEDHADEGAA